MPNYPHRSRTGFSHLAKLVSTALVPAASFIFPIPVHADLFQVSNGYSSRSFEIEFVTIGNPGNPDDRATDATIDTPDDPTDDEFSSPYGGVPYIYRMGKYPISVAQFQGSTEGNQEVQSKLGWYEAAWYVNWLNTISGHQPAYNLTQYQIGGPYPQGYYYRLQPWSSEDAWQLGGENRFRHKNAKYFLPSEDEWYKSVYHANNGPTADYWDYGHGSNLTPDGPDFQGDPEYDMVFRESEYSPYPAIIQESGVPSPYGTIGQTGNFFEHLESAFDGINDVGGERRTHRGGAHYASAESLRSSYRGGVDPSQDTYMNWVSFRVASVVPEPSAAFLVGFGCLAVWWWQRSRSRAA